jgi:hypothetical protein
LRMESPGASGVETGFCLQARQAPNVRKVWNLLGSTADEDYAKTYTQGAAEVDKEPPHRRIADTADMEGVRRQVYRTLQAFPRSDEELARRNRALHDWLIETNLTGLAPAAEQRVKSLLFQGIDALRLVPPNRTAAHQAFATVLESLRP